MRDLTIDELDGQLAEQLPARELMGAARYCGCYPSHGTTFTWQSNSANIGNGNGNGNESFGLLNLNGVGNGDGNVVLQTNVG